MTLARAAFAALVAGSVAALFIAQALKREVPLLLKPRPTTVVFEPRGNGLAHHRQAHFEVKASVGEVVDAWVLTSAGREVAVVARGLVLHEYSSRPLHWDGRAADGRLEPPGFYLLRVRLVRSRQTFVVPGFRLALEGPAG